MENSHQYSQNNDTLEKQSKEKPLLLNQIIINDKSSSVNNKKEIANTLPLLENMIKSNNNALTNQSEKPRKNSVIKIVRINQDETNKDNSTINQETKQSIIRKERKNQTVNMVRKPRKNNELGGTIKIIGKVSAKLESLIQRLGQNINKEKISNTRIENKYVMGPRIKAAIEMFNKKIEEEEKKKNQPLPKFIYKYVTIPDSEQDKKSQSVREKVKFTQEIDEGNREEEEEDESVDTDLNQNKNNSDNKYLSSSNKNENKNKKKKRKKKNSIKVLNLSRDSSSEEEDENDKINIKRKRKKNRKENSNSNSEESGEDNESNNKENKNKKRQSMTKKKTFNFSEDKSEKSQEEKTVENEDEEEITRNFVKHKSGRAHIMIKKVSHKAYIISSDRSSNSIDSIEKNKESENNKITQQNPINISKSYSNEFDDKNNEINKPDFKIVEYDKFTYKQYIVKNYHPKPVTIWKKQIKKYIPSKQIDFSLFAIKDKVIKYKKDTYANLNNNSNDFNHNKKRTIKNKGRKSVCPTINNNFLFNLKKKFDIKKYEANIYDLKKNLLINKQVDAPRKRYQSIFLNNNISINEFDKKFNKNNNNAKKNKNNVHDILQKKGFNSINTECNDKQNKKVKFNIKNIENSHSNKNQENNIKEIPEKEKEKEDEIIKETHFGVKYIVFKNKNELKTIYKKEQWKLSIIKVASIFLKAIKNSNIKDISNNNTAKNALEIETLSKNNFDKNNKIEKTSFKYISNEKNNNNKNKIKKNDFSNKLNERSDSSSSSDISTKNILNNKYNNETINKDYNSNKETDNNKKQIQPTNNLYFNYISNINYNKETIKKENDLIVKSINSGSNISESLYKKHDMNYSTELNNNNSLKNTLTNKARKMNRKFQFNTEKKDKKISKVKSKKARIKKFESLKDDSEFEDNKIKRKGNLYDNYTSKKQIERKKFVNEDCYKQNTLNVNDKIINSRYGFNTNKKSISLKKCSSGKNNRNNSSNKKNNVQNNPITFFGNNENNKKSSLIMNYRQKIIEGISNQNYNSNNKNTNNKNTSKNNVNKSMSALRRKNDIKIKLNPTKEISKIEAIKSKMKKRLIEIDNKLIDAINYYNGPIDISCISTKNYLQTVEELAKRALKNGYQCSKLDTNYYKLGNSFSTFFVEIVKIRNNLLYYLIVKNKK